MDLKSDLEVEVTREKLHSLEARYEMVRQDAAGNPRVQELTLRSLKRIINQFKEEIARFEAHAGVK